MNIRPRNATGVKFTQQNANGANWRQQVFDHYRQHILDTLSANDDGYGYWLNEMQGRHANIYQLAGGEKGNWQNVAYQNNLVGQYQHDYKGDQRFGTYNPGQNYTVDFNNLGIVKAQEQNRYDTSGPRRISGDYGDKGFKVDNLYSAITDDRRLLGRLGDWDDASLNEWNTQLKNKGWEMYLDKDNYYKLRRLPSQESPNNPPSETLQQQQTPQQQKTDTGTEVGGNGGGDKKETPQQGNDLLERLRGIIPGLLSTGRLAGNLINNARVYDEALKGIRPTLIQPYYTHRQVVGDEATKQAYYRRAAAGQTAASRPFTSDADRQMAYMQEARRVGDELRAQGDLADKSEIILKEVHKHLNEQDGKLNAILERLNRYDNR